MPTAGGVPVAPTGDTADVMDERGGCSGTRRWVPAAAVGSTETERAGHVRIGPPICRETRCRLDESVRSAGQRIHLVVALSIVPQGIPGRSWNSNEIVSQKHCFRLHLPGCGVMPLPTGSGTVRIRPIRPRAQPGAAAVMPRTPARTRTGNACAYYASAEIDSGTAGAGTNADRPAPGDSGEVPSLVPPRGVERRAAVAARNWALPQPDRLGRRAGRRSCPQGGREGASPSPRSCRCPRYRCYDRRPAMPPAQ